MAPLARLVLAQCRNPSRSSVDIAEIPRERGGVSNASEDQNGSWTGLVGVTRSEALLLVDGLRSLEYWDYGTELDLPRRNGEVYLPEDDGSWWGDVGAGSDEENAIKQIRILRRLAARIESQAREA